MFKRYPPLSRRAIFYAHTAALNAGKNEIDSLNVLCGLMQEKDSRANSVLKLDERFPEEVAHMRAMKRAFEQKEIPLSRDAKRILAYAAEEANAMADYWIDTDHLVLGILRERGCTARSKLEAAGFEIVQARLQVSDSYETLESHGPIPALWQLTRPITRVGHFAGIGYVVLLLVLLEIFVGKGC